MATQLTKAAETAPAEFGASLLEVIRKAAGDPSVDIDKFERLVALQERVEGRDAKLAFTEAKLAMRPLLPEITMKGKIVIKDKNTGAVTQETPFARFEDIHAAVTPILTEHGFDLAFRNGLSDEGKVRVTTILTHAQGHSEETYFDLPHDSSGSKNAVQAVGSSTSYAKRYGVLSILNLRVAGEDDDANTAIPAREISVKQYDELGKLIHGTQSDEEKFVQFLIGAGKLKAGQGLDDLPAEHFDFAKDALILKAAKASDGK
jgi:hypothetical protein